VWKHIWTDAVLGYKLKRLSFLTILTITLFLPLSGCAEPPTGFGYETNGILEGTVWVKGDTILSLSRNGITVNKRIDFGTRILDPGTYYSYFSDNGNLIVHGYSSYNNYGVTDFGFRLNGVALSYYSDNLGTQSPFYPATGTLFRNGNARFYNNFVAEETKDGLTITKYTGSQKNLVIPAVIGDMPVVAIGKVGSSSPFALNQDNDSFLQLTTVIIPPGITTIAPGVFRSRSLSGYLGGGITIGANVTIMGANAGAGWDQDWGALDVAKVGAGNFIAYESEHVGFWLDMGFVQFYNENGRQAGKYTWSSSYNKYDYKYTFTWAFTPPA